MKLPEEYENKNTLENMQDYTSCFVVPRAMRVDEKDDCHLNEAFTGDDSPGGTVQLKVTKVPEGYIVHIDEMEEEYAWNKQSDPGSDTDIEKGYGNIVAFSIEQYCKKYSVSPKRFTAAVTKSKSVKSGKIIKDIIRNLSSKFSKN